MKTEIVGTILLVAIFVINILSSYALGYLHGTKKLENYLETITLLENQKKYNDECHEELVKKYLEIQAKYEKLVNDVFWEGFNEDEN